MEEVPLCFKCKAERAVIAARMGQTCRSCFEASVVNRFKTNIIRRGKVKWGDRVLVGLSTGPSSRALVHLLGTLTGEEARKKLLFDVYLVHVNEGAAALENRQVSDTDAVHAIAHQYNLPLAILPLEALFSDSSVPWDVACQCEEESDPRSTRVKDLFASCTSRTTQEDLLGSLVWQTILRHARAHGISKILRGDTAMRVAVRLIALTSKGGGFQLPGEQADVDTMPDGIRILRPLRDVLPTEVAFYNHVHGLSYEGTNHPGTGSINQLTEAFLVDLQSGFPSTTPTILSTGEKLASPASTDDTPPRRCPLCAGCLDPMDEQEAMPSSVVCVCYPCRTLLTEVNVATLPPFLIRG